MVSIVVVYCDPSDVCTIKDIVKRTGGAVLPTIGNTAPPSAIVFHCNQDIAGDVIETLSNEIPSINRISEIRNVEESILKCIGESSDYFPTKSYLGILESRGIETIISSASAVMHTNGIQIHQIYLSNNPVQYSMYTFSGEKDIVDKTLNSARKVLESTKRVMGKYEVGD